MQEDTHDRKLTIIGTDVDVLDRDLNQALMMTREKAMAERRRGILVTHQAPGHFTVALSEDVPFGVTRQKVSW